MGLALTSRCAFKLGADATLWRRVSSATTSLACWAFNLGSIPWIPTKHNNSSSLAAVALDQAFMEIVSYSRVMLTVPVGLAIPSIAHCPAVKLREPVGAGGFFWYSPRILKVPFGL